MNIPHRIRMTALERQMGRYMRGLDGHEGEPPAGEPPAGEPPAAPDYSFLPPELVKEGALDAVALKAHYEGLAPRAADLPASAEAYTLDGLGDGVDADGLKESVLFKTLAASAHKQGIGQAAFAETIKDYVEAETAKADSFAAEQKTLLGTNAETRIAAVGTWLGSKLPAEGAAALQAMTTTAAGVIALEQLMGGAPAPRVPPPPPATTDTKEEIEKLQASPAYYDRSKRDSAVVARVEKFYADQAAAKAK